VALWTRLRSEDDDEKCCNVATEGLADEEFDELNRGWHKESSTL
jgi:hypothetical protein